MSAATWSIRNPIPAILLFLLLTLAGLWSFHALHIQNFPDLDLPAVNVVLRLPGTAPAQLETEVARKVEDSIATLEGLQHLVTNITDGQVNILTDFGDGLPTATALRDYVLAARDTGFDTVAGNDHLRWRRPWLDGLGALAAVAADAGPLTLATTVALPVVRHPAVLAAAMKSMPAMQPGPVVFAKPEIV